MAEAVILVVIASLVLVLSTSYLMHIFKFYALRALFTLFRLEKGYRNMTPSQTKASHMTLDIMHKPKVRRERQWISSERLRDM